jgi:NitT/TauT family transport system substrate-binding protein
MPNFKTTLLALTFLTATAHADDKPADLKIGILKMAALTNPWIAQQKGIFAKNGLNVQLVEFNTGNDAISAGRSGAVDILLSIPGTAMIADERGFNLVAIFQNEVAKPHTPDSGSVQVQKDSDIHTLKDLIGKKVAVSALHSQNTVALQTLMTQQGIPLDQITWVEIPFPSQADLLRTKQVDAVATVDPYTTQLLTSGVGRVISYNYVEAEPEMPLGAWFVRRPFLDKNADTISKFNLSIKESIDWMNADPARARAAVTEFTGLDPALVQNMPMIGWDYHVKMDKWQGVVDMMKAAGELQQTHTAAEYMAPELKPYIQQ